MKQIILLVLLSTFFFSCADNPGEPGISSEIFGTWVLDSYAGDILKMHRAVAFEEDNIGIRIENNHRYIEHKINGWCGTPPVTYMNYDGMWTREAENILKISVGFWGGKEEKQMKIHYISQNKLEISYKYLNP